jgi:hypothetical protein
MTQPQHKDQDLSRVYSEGAWPEPSRQIDDAILEASRRAARARHPVLHRWGPPFALAATVVVGVSLALLVTERQSVRDMSDYFRSSEPEAPKPGPQRRREAAAPAAPASRADAAPKVQSPSRELFDSPMGPGSPEPKPAAPAAKAPAPAAKAPAPLAKIAPPAAKSAPLAAPAAKAGPGARAQSQALPGPAAPPDPQRVQRELDQLQQNREARAAAPAAASPATSSSASVSELRDLAAGPAAARSPESWLDDIRKLRTQGRSADAARELAEFKKRYPDFRVPEDLR